jgi:hypothetical protein
MAYNQDRCYFKRLTSSGVVGDSGKPIMVAGYSVLSGGTAAIPYFRNGTGVAGDTIAWRAQGQASTAFDTAKSLPVMLDQGCYVSFDANTTEITVYYIQSSVTT